jgi:glycosyltransferase involved in cell wall biosynthesis
LNNNKTIDPLVSVVVITYNSTNYILETLESIKNQTYSNIELIISDDCSSDNTINICEKWLIDNGKSFKDFKIIRAIKNTGVAANCNRGVSAANGDWVKLIAGDDLLLPNCIGDNIKFTKNHPNINVFISNMIVFLDGTFPRKILEIRKPSNKHIWNQLVSINKQYEVNLLEYHGNTPSYFINSKVYEIIKYDDSFPFLEDYPFSLNALKSGFKIEYLDVDTVLYRERAGSLSKANNNVIYSSFFLKEREFDEVYRVPFLSNKRRKMEAFEFNRKKYILKFNLNHNNFFCKLINSISIRLNPYRYF